MLMQEEMPKMTLLLPAKNAAAHRTPAASTGSGCSPELTPAPAVAPNIFRASCPPEAHLCLGPHEQPIVHQYFVELRIWEYLTLKYRQVALPSPSQLKHLTSLTRGKNKETNPQDLHTLRACPKPGSQGMLSHQGPCLLVRAVHATELTLLLTPALCSLPHCPKMKT